MKTPGIGSGIETRKPERRYDLDWLRVLAVLLLVPFHSALIFSHNPGDIVYVKDRLESETLIQFAYFQSQWHMPLLFMIAGASTWFALEFRTVRQYLRDRFTRLVIPTVFGVTVLIPPMIYMQYLGEPGSSFWQFYPRFFQVNFEDLSGNSGTFTPSHLWFVIFLFVFSVVALPLFLFLKREAGTRLLARLARFLKRRGAILLLALPLAVADVLLDIGGKAPFLYLTLFIYGFVLVADARFQDILENHAVGAAGLGAIATVPIVYLISGRPVPQHSLTPVVIHLVYYLSRWCWLVAILGLGRRYLNFNHGILRYASEASYPFYILHFLINTVVGTYVVPWDASIGVKYLAINGVTILVTYAVYDLVVKRMSVTRILFGMKPRMHKVTRASIRNVLPLR
jgi:glucan biosynthesis protein C